ncbi:hypothetical protein [Phaffia rhodozyma]|uniref:Secreted protein n=1 Tax=Phaffia rhodozyma TaxID=264483 RepID=A0A0F7SNU7_PHARH|nr:hypothetical protein [Phaffia rhodozyma]
MSMSLRLFRSKFRFILFSLSPSLCRSPDSCLVDCPDHSPSAKATAIRERKSIKAVLSVNLTDFFLSFFLGFVCFPSLFLSFSFFLPAACLN